jgi:hypothetical protein
MMMLNFDEINEFIRYEQFNEYFIKHSIYIGVIEYSNYTKVLLPSEHYFNILNKFIEVSEYNDNNFCINQHHINQIGIDLNRFETFSNKVNRICHFNINELKNIKNAFKKCKLQKNIDYVIESRYIDINTSDSINSVKFTLSKIGFNKVIKKFIGLDGYTILITCLSSIIFHYNNYILKWNTLNQNRIKSLRTSIFELSNALNNNTENIINDDDDIIDSQYERMLSNQRKSSLHTPSENSLDDISNKSETSKNTIIQMNKFNLRNTVIPVQQLKFQSARPFAQTFMSMRVSNFDSRSSVPLLEKVSSVEESKDNIEIIKHDNMIQQHINNINSQINDRQSTLSNKLFIINSHIETMMDSISLFDNDT